jgi:hypothetical protein
MFTIFFISNASATNSERINPTKPHKDMLLGRRGLEKQTFCNRSLLQAAQFALATLRRAKPWGRFDLTRILSRQG